MDGVSITILVVIRAGLLNDWCRIGRDLCDDVSVTISMYLISSEAFVPSAELVDGITVGSSDRGRNNDFSDRLVPRHCIFRSHQD